MKRFLFCLPLLLISACITINTVPQKQTSAKQTLPPDGIKMKPPAESVSFVDTTDGLTYKWVKVRVYSSYPVVYSSDRVMPPRVVEPPLPPVPPAKPAMLFTPVTGTFKDERDGQVYKTVTIGKQTWMAQNLNYATANGSFTYNDDQANRKIYGLYYSVSDIPEACPKGWHLPTDEEWQQLEIAVGMDQATAASKGWRGNVSDKLMIGGAAKFDVLYGGLHRQGHFAELGEKAYFWTASKMGVPTINRIFQKSDDRIFREGMGSAYGLNVRCVKDEILK
jgi:uncharacterized protein (TIGR02145 family)